MVLKVTDSSFPGKLYVSKEDIVAVSLTQSQDLYIFIRGVFGKIQISPEHWTENDPLHDVILSLKFN